MNYGNYRNYRNYRNCDYNNDYLDSSLNSSLEVNASSSNVNYTNDYSINKTNDYDYYSSIVNNSHNNSIWPECRNCTITLCNTCKVIRSEYTIFLYIDNYMFILSTDRFTLSKLYNNKNFKVSIIPLKFKYGYLDYNMIMKTIIDLKNNKDINYLKEYEKNKFRVN